MIRLLLLFALSGCAPSTEALYARYTEDLTRAGLMRTERTPPDAPFTDADLIRNFQRIAFGVEAFDDQRAGIRPLRRWQGPVTWNVISPRPADIRMVTAMMARLAGLTGLELGRDPDRPQIVIFFIDSHTREDLARYLDTEEGPGARILARAMRVGDRVSPCHAGMAGDEIGGTITAAYVIIKDETPGPLRRACVEEELAQVMGLTNDDPDVRPSVFNDDQEFALLTGHDAMLLRMLYHPAMRPGMTREEAGPLLPRVLSDLRGREG